MRYLLTILTISGLLTLTGCWRKKSQPTENITSTTKTVITIEETTSIMEPRTTNRQSGPDGAPELVDLDLK